MKLCQGGLVQILGKDLSSSGCLGTGQAPQGTAHSTKANRVQKMFGQCSEAQGGILGVPCAGPEVE